MVDIAAKDLGNSMPATSAITNMDAFAANFVGKDWNLLAPSDSTLARVDKDNAPVVPVANIFQYLQSLKDRADLEHEVMMYRYKRTFECATEGLKALAEDSVTTDEYKVLVRWMYDHCAAGNTKIEMPKDLPITDIDTPWDSDAKTDVKRQFMTKLDFYYEIKSYFAERSEKLNGEVAAIRLRSEETKELEEKMIDCIDDASERFGFQVNSNAYATTKHLKAAIAWVEDSCMKA